MEYKHSDYYGFERLDFIWEGREAVVVLPEKTKPDKRWMLKTEYFGAFPALELELLRRGYADAHVDNKSRWCLDGDTQAQNAFGDFLVREFGFHPQCVPVGMSCGGLQAVYLAARYPQRIRALCLDAPVINFLSCPFAVGREKSGMEEEFIRDKGMTLSECINFRGHPADFIPELVRHRLPVLLIAGDSDTVVPYHENGILIERAYEKTDIPFMRILKPGCNHHPHGPVDCKAAADFIDAAE